MNILYISHEKDLNGASRSLLGIIDELSQKKFNIYVLTSYIDGKFIEELKKRNVNIIYSRYLRWIIYKPKNKFKWNIKKMIFKILRLVNIYTILKTSLYVKKYNIDIIHTNSSVIDIGAYISKLSNIPHIFHIREFGEEDFNMYPIYNKKRRLDFINKNSEKIIVISKAILDKYKKYFNDEKIKLVYNGIDERFLNFKSSKIKEEYTAMIAGRIEEAKGQKEAILAINELKNKNIENIKLKIIGSGEKLELNKLINHYGLQDFIEVRDYCDNLFEVRKNIDFELVCSKNEAFGRVTIESMMSSNPVIGSNTGGTKELIIDGFNGFLYERGNYKDLAEKIIRLIDKNEIEKISKNAFKYSKEEFTSKINANNINLVYEEILNG
ncbi:glycosyltransferase family 4 protein [Paraclostridium sordellii]|uniref:glycosyltransferase family 4 protein n=1 Tax=Paraclostridium sordellii TaxID=1505 RepID=UPI0030D2C63F